MVSIAHAVNPALYQRLPYDSMADFVPVAPVAVVPNLLAVPAARPWRTQAELVEAARRRPGELTYGSAGSGTSIHLAGALFGALAGIEMTHVPYRGSGPAVADLVSGRVDAMFDSVTSAAAHRLGAAAGARGNHRPAHRGLPGPSDRGRGGGAWLRVDPWFAMLAPRSLPAEARERAGRVVGHALQDTAVRERFAAIGAEPMEGDAGSSTAGCRGDDKVGRTRPPPGHQARLSRQAQRCGNQHRPCPFRTLGDGRQHDLFNVGSGGS